MELLFATGNQNKYEMMKRRLSSLNNLNVIMPKSIGIKIEVEENGKTAEENAIKKAIAYYEKVGLPTIAEDSGLYVEKFSDEEQPGLFVRRVNGRDDLTDTEVLNYYIEKLNAVGGESLARYETGIAIVDKEGKIYSTTVIEEPFLFTSKRNEKDTIQGGMLDCISYDINNRKYFNELSNFEKNKRYEKLDKIILNLVSNIKDDKN